MPKAVLQNFYWHGKLGKVLYLWNQEKKSHTWPLGEELNQNVVMKVLLLQIQEQWLLLAFCKTTVQKRQIRKFESVVFFKKKNHSNQKIENHVTQYFWYHFSFLKKGKENLGLFFSNMERRGWEDAVIYTH